jgi:hypothetical protein
MDFKLSDLLNDHTVQNGLENCSTFVASVHSQHNMRSSICQQKESEDFANLA